MGVRLDKAHSSDIMAGMPVNPMFHRLALIAGEGPVNSFGESRAFVFGVGGVGSWAAEALVRSGLGSIVIVDSDVVCLSNVNRQLQATPDAVGRLKVECLAERLVSINPACEVIPLRYSYSAENSGLFDIHPGDYVIDAIDSIGCKLDLIEHAARVGARLFSAMGAARKLDPTLLKIADIWETRGCPLARLVRDGLRKRGFAGNFSVVYGEESLPAKPTAAIEPSVEGVADAAPHARRTVNGSFVAVTATAGMMLASLVVRDAVARFGGNELP